MHSTWPIYFQVDWKYGQDIPVDVTKIIAIISLIAKIFKSLSLFVFVYNNDFLTFFFTQSTKQKLAMNETTRTIEQHLYK